MTNMKKMISSTIVCAGLLISGCGSSDDNVIVNYDENTSLGQSTNKSVSINFDAVVGDQGSLTCSENGVAKIYTDLGSTDANGTIADFRFFVSEVKLIMEDGTKQDLVLENNDNQYYDETNGSVVILDFEDNTGNCVNRGNDTETYTTIVGDINSSSEISAIEFTIGVPLALNHIEFPEISALTKAKMNWSWAAGRKFTKFEVNPTDDLNSSGDIFNFHLGSTGCSDSDADGFTDDCTQPNRVTLTFDFDPDTQKIVIDYAELLTYVNIAQDQGGSKGCMSKLDDPECMSSNGKMFNAIGLNDAGMQGECIAGDCTLNQQMFSVQSK